LLNVSVQAANFVCFALERHCLMLWNAICDRKPGADPQEVVSTTVGHSQLSAVILVRPAAFDVQLDQEGQFQQLGSEASVSSFVLVPNDGP
jgi:hypothetical protein